MCAPSSTPVISAAGGSRSSGQLGLGTSYTGGVGDNETPGSVPLLDLEGKKALAITAGGVPHLRPARRRQGLLLGRDAFTGAVGSGDGDVYDGLTDPPLSAGHVDFDTADDTAIALSASGDHTARSSQAARCAAGAGASTVSSATPARRRSVTMRPPRVRAHQHRGGSQGCRPERRLRQHLHRHG